MESELDYGTSVIRYNLAFESRRTLRIEVHADASVWVKAPLGTDTMLIRNRLLRRAAWILKQQRYYQTIQPGSFRREYVSGESFRYLGYQHRLKVEESSPERVKRVGSQLLVVIGSRADTKRIEKLLENWYRLQATQVFSKGLARCLARFASVAEFGPVRPIPDLRLRRMKGRWGSCTADGRLFLNPDLVQASTYCIDYVITHELAHLLEHNHSPAFYRVLTHAMPDWRERKETLARARWD